ncbi:MAG: PH domain-containing protein [Bacteroidia bacterium]
MEPLLFTNQPVTLEALPSVEDAPQTPLHPAFLKVQYIGTLTFMAFLIIPGIVSFFTDLPPVAGMIWFILWSTLLVVQMIILPMAFKKKSYSMREKDITYRTGLIWQSVTTIPYQRIQHSEVSRGPLEQLFGLASLKIYTAGGGSTDLEISGLDPEKATQMKDYILSQIVHDGNE